MSNIVERVGLDKVIASGKSCNRQLVVAMIVARIIAPASKLATTRALDCDSCTSTLAQLLGIAS